MVDCQVVGACDRHAGSVDDEVHAECGAGSFTAIITVANVPVLAVHDVWVGDLDADGAAVACRFHCGDENGFDDNCGFDAVPFGLDTAADEEDQWRVQRQGTTGKL